jgi:hypothetical protein
VRLQNEFSRICGGTQKFVSAITLVAFDRGFTGSKLREDWEHCGCLGDLITIIAGRWGKCNLNLCTAASVQMVTI